MTDYVVGFLMDTVGRVVLIEKKRPDWQAGLLNGVGGHVEPGELSGLAMQREFTEETGISLCCWDQFISLKSGEHTIDFYRHFTAPETLDRCKSTTDETVYVHSINWVLGGGRRLIPNLYWILPLARYTHDEYAPMEVREL